MPINQQQRGSSQGGRGGGTHKVILENVRGRTARKVVHAPAKVGHRSSVSVCSTRSSRVSPVAKRKPLPMCAVNSTTKPTCAQRFVSAACGLDSEGFQT